MEGNGKEKPITPGAGNLQDHKISVKDQMKKHFDQITKDPFAWAQDNPWKAAGGIGALTAATYGLANLNNGSNNNNGGSGFLSGLWPGLIVAGLTYGGLRAFPWVKDFMGKVNDTANNVRQASQNAQELSNIGLNIGTDFTVRTAGFAPSRRTLRNWADKYYGKPVSRHDVSANPKSGARYIYNPKTGRYDDKQATNVDRSYIQAIQDFIRKGK